MCFLIITKFYDDKKISIYRMDFLCQAEILLLNMLKLLKTPGFFFRNSRLFRLFQVFWQPCIGETSLLIVDSLTKLFSS